MKSVVAWAINNSPGMNMLMIGVLVVGAVSLYRMQREMFPAFEIEIERRAAGHKVGDAHDVRSVATESPSSVDLPVGAISRRYVHE